MDYNIKFTSEEQIEKEFLTPKEKEIEKIILNKNIPAEYAKVLRCLSAMNEEYKSTIHYHSSNYIEYLIGQAEEIIKNLKS